MSTPLLQSLVLGIVLVVSITLATFAMIWLKKEFSEQALKSQERLDLLIQQNRQEMQAGLGLSFQHFEKVQQTLIQTEQRLTALQAVGQSITDLNQLLKLPHLRGGFGESSLERLLSDFLPAGSYELQHMIDPGSLERVDAVVKLAHLRLPIDCKFPREQVLPLFDSASPEDLADARDTLAQLMRTQSRSIATKYIRPEHGTTDMALLFLPSETLYFEVVKNTALFEAMSRMRVFPVSPNTLAITLQSVSTAQEYYVMARGVERTLGDLRKARKHFEHFERKFQEVGKGLKKAQEAYDVASNHLGHYSNSVQKLVDPQSSLAFTPNPGDSLGDDTFA